LSTATIAGAMSDSPEPGHPLPPGEGRCVEQALEHAQFHRGPGENPAEHWTVRDDLTAMLQLGVLQPPRLRREQPDSTHA
jgi:hypothetical protein